MDYRDLLGHGICMACNSSQAACTSKLSICEQPCCAMCDHEGLR